MTWGAWRQGSTDPHLGQQPVLSSPASPHALVDGDPHSEQPAAVLLLYFPARALGCLYSGSGYGHSRDVK